MIGTTISHYRITEKLGQGGMGIVYKARDLELDRDVALKFLSLDSIAEPKGRERFRREAKAAAGLDHPNVCSIFDIGQTEDGHTYIVMAYYEGETLRDRISDSSIEIADAVDIAAQIAQGLSAAHRANIVHRDIKPANILLSREGLVKILDFGLAKVSNSSTLTSSRSTVGTLSYMSPQQVRGESVDHRTDLWSLGAVMYEMLTGQRPFEGEYNAATVFQILNETPKPISTWRPETPGYLIELVERCLAKDVVQRIGSADEFLHALRRDAASKDATRAQERSDGRKRNRYVVSGLVVAVLLGLALVLWAKVGRDTPEKQLVPKAAVDMGAELNDTTSIEGDSSIVSAGSPQRFSFGGRQQETVPVRTSDVQAAGDEASEGLFLDVWTDRGRDTITLRNGDSFQLYVSLDRQAFIRVINQFADGRKVLVEDNVRIPVQKVGGPYMLTELEVAPPLGDEVIQVIASTEKLAPLRTFTQDGYEFLSATLDEIPELSRGVRSKARVVEKQIRLTTTESDPSH